MRHYDAHNNRLVYLTGTALPDDWDERWSKSALKQLFAEGRNAWLVSETRRFLPPDSWVLEGGWVSSTKWPAATCMSCWITSSSPRTTIRTAID